MRPKCDASTQPVAACDTRRPRGLGRRPAARRPGARTQGGFTLVELLLVMFVLSVLVALVVGVGRYVIEEGRKQETITSQDRLMAAIAAYRKVTGEVPASDPNGYGNIDFLVTQLEFNLEKEDLDPSVQPESDFRKRYPQLAPKLWELFPAKAEIREATTPFLGGAGEGTSFRIDAYGKEMAYYADRGLGGMPVIISAGPDGQFGMGTGKEEEDKREDNIRSDTRK